MADVTLMSIPIRNFRFPNPDGGRIDIRTALKRTVGVFPKYIGAGQTQTTDTEIVGEFLLPSQYTNTTGLKIKFYWRAQDPIVAGDVIWEGAFETITASTDDSTLASWGTPAVNTASTAPTTNGQCIAVSIAVVKANVGNGGTPVAGEPMRVRVRRIGTSATDTLKGTVEILGAIELTDY